MTSPLAYNPAIFNVRTMDEAKRIILTTEGALTTDHRWRTETPYLVSLIEKHAPLDHSSIVLDYGCGVGRMSKALIDRFGCSVVGVDTSPSMRALASDYVQSDRFVVCHPGALAWLGVRFDLALAIWVLQHCYQVEGDIETINSSMKPAGRVCVVNDNRRIVPTLTCWANDGKDVKALLNERFGPGELETLDPDAMGVVAQSSYFACYRRP